MSVYYKDIQEEALKEFEALQSAEALDAFRIKYLGRSGVIAGLFAQLSSIAAEERPKAGKALNELKNTLKDLIDAQQGVLKKHDQKTKGAQFDASLPATGIPLGRAHILTQVIDEICRIFIGLGFRLFEGPEVETEYRNFAALNINLDHPSRDAFDTFYLEKEVVGPRLHMPLLLRSHTSPGQIHVMTKYRPPVAAIVPGKVYRPDATDASHSFMFHQVEGFLVDKNIAFSDLKGVLEAFSKEMFGEKTRIRFRPHYFPFTEPSAEVDVSCIICGGAKRKNSGSKPCSVCKGTGWLEVLGCGMIHPNVFKAVGYPHNAYRGFAFGMGADRIAMLRYGINDIRLFYENDVRFLQQF